MGLNELSDAVYILVETGRPLDAAVQLQEAVEAQLISLSERNEIIADVKADYGIDLLT